MKLVIKEAFDVSIPDWLKSEFKRLYGRITTTVPDRFGSRGNRNRYYDSITPSEVVYEEIPDYNLPQTAREFHKVAGYMDGVDTAILYADNKDDVVWIYGKTNPNVMDPRSGTKRSIDSIPLKYILPNIVHMGKITWQTDRKKTRASRRDDFDPIAGPDEFFRYGQNGYNVDKSGYYQRGLEPYKSKLGAKKLGEHEKIINSAVESLNELRSMYANITGGTPNINRFRTAVFNMSSLIEAAMMTIMDKNNSRFGTGDYENKRFLELVRKLEKAEEFCEQMVYDIIHKRQLKDWPF